jgi:hypothetical protein
VSGRWTPALNRHISTNNLLHAYQLAFRARHSAAAVATACTVGTGSICVLVLLEMSAAFDTMDQDILLSMLTDHVGVRDKALCWFTS